MIKQYEIRIVATTERGDIKDICAHALMRVSPAAQSKNMLSAAELLSIRSLIAFRAYNTSLPESLVESIFCADFDINSVPELTTDRYDSAVVWLVDWEPPLLN